MDTIMALWLPVLAAAISVFFLSFLFWMVLPHHRKDIQALPNEKPIFDAIASLDVPPGLYMWPNCTDTADYRSEEFLDRYRKGPWGTITIRPSMPNFRNNLLITFVVYLGVAACSGGLVHWGLGNGGSFMQVFPPAAIMAFLAYGLGPLCGATFLGKPLRFMVTDLVDGVVMAATNGVVLAALWPAAG
ncbi:MAG: hypothetical protein P8J59_01795 [Phycisphaerales bacterium]|jgi:hypothetical protein|nr:hypothetical protein [Phycisphaerales bacterium]